jgi:hypothetical protein
MDTDLTTRIESLKAQGKTRDTLRYPDEFKTKAIRLVADLRRAGWTQKAISQALEMPWETLRRWRKAEKSEAAQPDGFRPVRVNGPSPSGPVLVAPSGWRIEGLSVAEVLELARRLG